MRATRLIRGPGVSLVVGLALVSAVACGGDGSDVLAAPSFRDYDGQFVYLLNPLLSPSPDTLVVNCVGRVSIAEPALGDVSGMFLVRTRQGACFGAGDVLGSITLEGEVVLVLSTEGRPADEVFPAFGCRAIEGFRDFVGSITDEELMLETDFVAVCSTGGMTVRTQWLVSFLGER